VDWLNLIAGALIAAVPILIAPLFAAVRFYRSSQRRKYHGEFHLYHWSGTRPEVRHKGIRFSGQFRHTTRVRLSHDPVTHLAYTGDLYRGTGEVKYAMLRGDGHEERMMLIFYDPIDPQFEVTRGVMATVNLHGEPTTWRIVLSRQPLPEARVVDLLGPRELTIAKKIDLAALPPMP
jgi:hypothetical protein